MIVNSSSRIYLNKDTGTIGGEPISSIPEINDLTELRNRIENSSIPTFLKIGAPRCHLCKLADPVLEELAKDKDLAGKVQFLKTNSDQAAGIVDHFRLDSIPQFLSFPAGKFEVINDPHISCTGGLHVTYDRLKRQLTRYLINRQN